MRVGGVTPRTDLEHAIYIKNFIKCKHNSYNFNLQNGIFSYNLTPVRGRDWKTYYIHEYFYLWYSDTSAPLPPRPLVTSAPSHLGPTTISVPVWKNPQSGRPLVTSAPSHLGPIFIITSAASYNSIILMKRKKERNTLLRRKNLLYYCII